MTKNTPEIIKKLKTVRALLGDYIPTNGDGKAYLRKILDPQTVDEAITSVEFHDLEVRNAEIFFKFTDMIDDLIEQIPHAFAENERRQLARIYLE